MASGQQTTDELSGGIARARDLARRGSLQTAIGELEALARRSADPAPAIFEIGNLTKAAGLYDQAEAAFRQVMKTYPGSIEAATNLANVLSAKGQADTAIAILRNVQSVVQGNAIVDISLADALFADDRIEEALAAYDDLAARYAGYAPVHANRGEALARLGRHAEAIAALDKAAALDRSNPNIVRNRAFSRLAMGDMRGGFAEYEARLNPALATAPVRTNLTAPRWTGALPLDGPLLVVAEQGLGDEIRFAAALPDLIARAGDVVVECDPRLVDLLAASLPTVRVIPFDRRRDGQRPVFDYAGLPVRPAAWIEIGSLPHRLGLPGRVPMATLGYMTPDQPRANLMRARLKAEASQRPLIGFCWGSGAGERPRQRFYPLLRDWAPVLTGLDAAFVDLQYIPSAEDRATFRDLCGVEIIDTDDLDKRNDLATAACLAYAMDAVVGVSSSVAAMAGAVGTPTVEVTPERTWVPLVGGRDAWIGSIVAAYPDRPGDWPQAMQRALGELKDILDPSA
ncbi:tetratricopeptide repeat-containing glycosyltransferase family protein [Thalassobaculum sp. OXR-137]|uniref:tetratricopeptide repeat-containing glycosyltransferase family protein n=1 Tax=Thalassobaculum sp. OXR-137 TaxID=3100173 RepID=UPI002AC94C7A|nr:tetratricopeptide repeat-containing glycosyltransferase family protein [Thalassobaculum sp. OXR-137]WPZ34653.1 tetratricopeptide repeat-containing glycosyltransferase family protein [Thalassobaculum sp. OXR-137]